MIKNMLKRFAVIFCSAVCAFAVAACSAGSGGKDVQDEAMFKQLYLCAGDSYDFYAMNYIVDEVSGNCLSKNGDVVTADKAGEGKVSVTQMSTGESAVIGIRAFPDSASLGGRFNIDRGMFKGKKVIAFGDSITDGCLLDAHKPDGLNYEDTYFAKLCKMLQTASDPADLRNSNFACGGTTLTYGLRSNFGISGVQRVVVEEQFNDASRTRDPYSNIADAQLCVIFYGTNDFTEGVPVSADGIAGLNDFPFKASDAKTVKGGLYFMFSQLRKRNPAIKILVLPVLYRRAISRGETLSADKKDVIFESKGISLMKYVEAQREVSEEFGAKFIDWSSVFDYDSFGAGGQYTVDGLHPNVAGHNLMYEKLLKEISETNN